MSGDKLSNAYNLFVHSDVTPDPLKPPKNDPAEGFPLPRVERQTPATMEELESAKIPLQDRDYCSHYLLKFRACRKDVYPFVVRCAHQKHEYLTCMYDDYVHRMKEYERERRMILWHKKHADTSRVN